MKLFSESIQKINDVYYKLGYEQGWRFLYTNSTTLFKNNGIVFMGLNPGGSKYVSPIESVEEGNAYRIEYWGEQNYNSLQREVILLYMKVATSLGNSNNYQELMDKTLTSNFCPFRSPSWEKLKHKKEAIEFSKDLWSNIFLEISPKIIICMDGIVFKQLKIIFDKNGYTSANIEAKPTGWGKVKYTTINFFNEATKILLIRIPHLSRYKIISSNKCTSAAEHLIHLIAQNIIQQF